MCVLSGKITADLDKRIIEILSEFPAIFQNRSDFMRKAVEAFLIDILNDKAEGSEERK